MVWADNNYLYRKKITVSGACVSGTLTNFPVLVSGTSADLTKCRADGYDIVFYNSGNTEQLPHEREGFNGATGKLLCWVKLPTISGGNNNVDMRIPESFSGNTFWMYYGYASATDVSNRNAVWDTNFKAVYHSQYSSSCLVDSTSNGKNGTMSGTPDATTDGMISGAIDYVPDTEFYAIGNIFGGTPSAFTFEFIINPDIITSDDGILGRGPAETPVTPYVAIWEGPLVDIQLTIGATAYFNRKITPILNTWQYVVFTYDDNGSDGLNALDGFLNGVHISSLTTTGGNAALNYNLWIGRYANTTTHGFDGTIDEVRLSNVERSPEWIWTTYSTIWKPNKFLRFDVEENKPVVQEAGYIAFISTQMISDQLYMISDYIQDINVDTRINLRSGYNVIV